MDDKNTAYLSALAGLGAQPNPVTRDEALLNAIADRLDALEEGGGLPAVTSDDNGDVLTVVSGAWAKAAPSGGGSRFVVTLTYDSDNDRYTADKTAAEIHTAASSGSEVVCFFPDSGWLNYYPLVQAYSSGGDYYTEFASATIVSNEFGDMGHINRVIIRLESATPSVTVDSFETQAYYET